jgi:hypothetical protein
MVSSGGEGVGAGAGVGAGVARVVLEVHVNVNPGAVTLSSVVNSNFMYPVVDVTVCWLEYVPVSKTINTFVSH